MASYGTISSGFPQGCWAPGGRGSQHYYGLNVDFFANIGSPGGASSVGRIGWDHPLMASLKPQPH